MRNVHLLCGWLGWFVASRAQLSLCVSKAERRDCCPQATGLTIACDDNDVTSCTSSFLRYLLELSHRLGHKIW